MQANYYYESHVTIEPLTTDEQIDKFTVLCRQHNFHPAKLFMQKRPSDTEERSKYDSFCSSRSRDYDTIVTNTVNLVKTLKEAGFRVWRYKVEDIQFDSKVKDIYNLL